MEKRCKLCGSTSPSDEHTLRCKKLWEDMNMSPYIDLNAKPIEGTVRGYPLLPPTNRLASLINLSLLARDYYVRGDGCGF